MKKELDHLKVDLSAISDKCEEFFSQAAASPSIESLQVELNSVIQTMNMMYSMSSIYLEKYGTCLKFMQLYVVYLTLFD